MFSIIFYYFVSYFVLIIEAGNPNIVTASIKLPRSNRTDLTRYDFHPSTGLCLQPLAVVAAASMAMVAVRWSLACSNISTNTSGICRYVPTNIKPSDNHKQAAGWILHYCASKYTPSGPAGTVLLFLHNFGIPVSRDGAPFSNYTPLWQQQRLRCGG